MADWHPIMATTEPEPGHWVMVDPYGRPYGDVRIVRAGGEVGYRAEFAASSSGTTRICGRRVRGCIRS